MTKPFAQRTVSQDIAYSIYTFAHEHCTADGICKWAKHSSVLVRQEALDEAKGLFGSGKYRKVEVKQRYFDQKKECHIDMTLKVYEDKKHGKSTTNMVTVFCLLFFLALGAFFFL